MVLKMKNEIQGLSRMSGHPFVWWIKVIIQIVNQGSKLTPYNNSSSTSCGSDLMALDRLLDLLAHWFFIIIITIYFRHVAHREKE